VNYLGAVFGMEIWALWLILAFLILLVEIFSTTGFFISASISAAVMSLETYLRSSIENYSDFWHWAIWASLSIILYFPVSILLKRFTQNKDDINQY
jgi:membrane protein implicated in regulation of membrane protease activity